MKKAFLPLLICSILYATPQYGISLINGVKYPKDFKHFDYVNPIAPKGGKLKMGSPGAFDSLNPYVIIGNAAPGIGVIHATLFAESEDEPSTSYPYVADSLEISDDKTEITFNLNKKAEFHDGKPLTAHDVVFTFNILCDKGKPIYKQYYADITEVKALDTHTVKFINKNPKNKELPAILSQLVVLPKHYYEKHEFDKTSLDSLPGAGPYKVKKIDAGQLITYERIKNWWGKEIPSQVGFHNFDEIEYITYRDDNAMFEAFKKGLIDVRLESSSQNWTIGYNFDAFKQGKVKKTVLQEKNPKPTYGFFFNTRHKNLQNINVRQALIQCLDFEWLNKYLFYNLYKRNNSYFPLSLLSSEGKTSDAILKKLQPFNIHIQNVEVVRYKTNAEKRNAFKKAQELLQKAGYILKNGKQIHRETKEPLTLNALLKSPKITKIALSLKENMERIGVELHLIQPDSNSYAERLESYDYDLVFEAIGQSTTPGNELINLFGSQSVTTKGGMNYAGIHDKVVDNLIEQIKTHETDEELVETVQALDLVLLNGAYMIPAWYFDGYMVAYWNHMKFADKHPPYTRNFVSRWWHQPKT